MTEDNFTEEQPIEDAFLAKYEKEKQALQVLFPNKEDFDSAIRLIGQLSGTTPHLQKSYLAHCEWKILDAMEKDSDINWDELDPVKFLFSHAPSLKGRHADRAVEIARASQITAQKGIWDRILGKD